MPTLASTLAYSRGILKDPSQASLLLAHFLRKPKEYLVSYPEDTLSEPRFRRFLSLLQKRRKGIPYAYLTHEKEFFGLSFYVDHRVLIPRPETELLVEETIERAKTFAKPKILDLGTGSGCIAISLAKYLPEAQIIASDISKGALKVAEKNMKRHHSQSRVKLMHGDLLKPFRKIAFDIIVMNPPYVPRHEFSFVEPEVKKYEPHLSLWGGKDGLFYFRRFFRELKLLKKPPRYIIAEFGFSMKEQLKHLLNKFFVQKSMVQIMFKKDLAGHDRLFILKINSYA